MNFKRILNSYPQRSANEIIRKIQAYDVISFDVFDTLLKRDVESENDVFELVEKQYNLRHQDFIKGFKTKRIAAEIEARNSSTRGEVTVDEIYECLVNSHFYDLTVVSELRKIEESTELAVCTINRQLIKAFEYCKKYRKKIIIISDMYWPASFVEALLNQNGISGYDAIYVSSEVGVQKRQNGALFKYVAEKEKINKNKWVHIGDNKKADYISAKKAGIAAVNIAKHYKNTEYIQNSKRNDTDRRVISSFINNRIPVSEKRDVRLGYEVYGPQLYFLVKWFGERIPLDATVMFCARDCYIIKQAYELLYGADDRFKYFLGSRKSLILAALNKDNSLETVSRMLKSEPVQMTVKGFLTKLNLNPADYRAELDKTGLMLDTIIYRDNLSGNHEFVDFYDSIKADVGKKAEDDYQGLKNYLADMDCTKDIIVIDIGWRCTMQYCLQEIFPEHNWKGYYLGVREDAVVKIGREAEGFYLNGEDDFEKKCFLASLTALMEIFFSAPHGSVTGYSKDGEVLYAPYECQDDAEHREFLKDIQRGALKFVEDFEKSKVSTQVEVSSENMLLGLDVLAKQPQKQELVKIGGYPFHLGVGVVNAAEPKPLVRYIVNPKLLLYDFSNSTWKVAFLKRMLKIKLPYYKMFRWIYKHKG